MIVSAARRASVAGLCAVLVLAAGVGAAGAAGAGAASPGPRLSVRAAVLVDADSGQRLYGVDPNRELPIASTTKLMTALIVLEHARLGRKFRNPTFYLSPADSQIGLAPGERMSVHDLLLALLLPSADDAAEDLAYNVGHRSVGRFIGMMNARARQLGLGHTHYTTPIGLDTPGNYSTASDLVKLAAYVLRTQPFFARAVGLPRAVLRTGNHVRVIANRNDLVSRFSWIKGVKTGHTSAAGYVLVGLGERHRLRLLSAVLGTSSEAARDANTLALLNYGFRTFAIRTVIRKGQVVARPTVKDSPGKHAVVVASASLRQLLPRSARVYIRAQVPHQLAGPMRQGTVVGVAVVRSGGRTLGRIPLLLARALPAVSPLTVAARFITRTTTLVPLAAVLAVVAVTLLARRRLRMRRTGEEGAEPA